jgi:hypothetical protein
MDGAKIHYMGDGNVGPRGGKLYVFHCPGCGFGHPFEIDAPNGAGWTWNGSLDRPTFTPSLMVARGTPTQCHVWVTDGKIQFLADSHHALAGRTVDLPDWEN